MAKYRKIIPRMWKDEGFRSLTGDEKLVAIYIITAQSNRIGLFPFSPALACEDLETLPQTFVKRMGNVCHTLDWTFDEGSRTVYIPTWWKYNPPDNANTLIGNLKDIAELPETPMLPMFCNNTEYLPETLREPFLETLRQRYPKRMATQYQYQKQYQEAETEMPPASGRASGKQQTVVFMPPGFHEFWTAYPKRKAIQDAKKAWTQLNPSAALQETILASLQKQKQSVDWKKDEGKFIPHAATWLRGRRWDDEMTVSLSATTPAPMYPDTPETWEAFEAERCDPFRNEATAGKENSQMFYTLSGIRHIKDIKDGELFLNPLFHRGRQIFNAEEFRAQRFSMPA